MSDNLDSSRYPTGAVTFLFTDLEASSHLWEKYPQAMQAAMARHDAILRGAVERNQGLVVKSTGDGLHAVFASPDNALQATFDAQCALLTEDWSGIGPLRVRMGLHTGQAQWREGDYYGPAVNRAARVMSVAAGGQILLSYVTAELVRDHLPGEYSLIDLGQHRLRSLDRPERLFQLNHPNLPEGFPALESSQTTSNNLPAQLTSFIGRKAETTQVKTLLAPESTWAGDSPAPDSTHRLVTLIGPGGTGKTRLSLQVANELLDTFPDGVWLVELAPLTDPDRVVQAAAEPFGLSEQPGRPLIAMLVDHLRAQKVLLVLDNCEHLIDACAQLADELLQRCPQLRILASSREALGIAGERAFRVQSLSLPAGNRPLSAAELAEYDSVQLFVTRAKVAKSSFALTDENAPVILPICRRLDGIPLAIELAAARTRMLSPQQILDRLDDRFRLLTGGSRTALPRQRTLQALIDWSYDLLAEEERVLLRRLSIFSGGWSLEAAENITGVEPLDPIEILDLLEQLHNKSLITASEGDMDIRYTMLETVRQYAQLKLAESGEADELRDRHLFYYLEKMDQGKEAILSLRGAGWQELMIADNDNFRAARERALETDIRLALNFASNLSAHWTIIFPASEVLQYVEKCRALAEMSSEFNGTDASPDDRKLLAAALASAAFMCLILGLPSTIDFAMQAAAIAREQGATTTLAVALTSAVARSRNAGDFEAAQTYFKEVQPLIPDLDSAFVKALFYSSMALVVESSSEQEVMEAWRVWEKGMAMFRESGEIWGLALGHQIAARVSFNRADFAKAEYHARRSLELYTDFGEVHVINMPRSWLAEVYRQKGEYDLAEPLYKQSTVGWRNVAQFGAVARCLESLAFVSLARGQEATAGDRSQYLSRSATLLGAAGAVRQIRNTPMNLMEQAEYEEKLPEIKSLAGDELFSEAWQQGQRMDLDSAVAFASASDRPQDLLDADTLLKTDRE